MSAFLFIDCPILSLRDEKLWELKEKGKWSLSLEERKKAVAELANYHRGEAVRALSEIRDTTAFEEIRQACMDAIMSAKKNHTDSSIESKKKPTKVSGRLTRAKKKKVQKAKRAKKAKKRRR